VLEFVRTADQREIRAQVRAFAAAEIAPFAGSADRDRAIPDGLGDRFHATGIPARYLSSDIHGPYLSEVCMVTEELGYACAACASYLMLPVFFNRFLLRHLAPTESSRLRADLEQRHVVTAFAASERDGGSDLNAMAVTVRKKGEGYRLDGRKEYSTNGGIAERIIVVANGPSPSSGKSTGLTWLHVSAALPGVSIGSRWDTLGLRALDVSPLQFDNVVLPRTALLGEEGRGLQLMNQNLAQSRTGIAALAVGVARRARDLVADFAKHRRLYGERLSRLQDYRFRIADMEADIAAAHGLVAASAERFDRGLSHNKEASVAKLYAGQMVMRVVETALTMLGSIGYTGQTPIDKLFRDARHTAIVEGPEPIHREIIFAEMLRHGAV
jgi:alkylation response protein AidB-like acyl-CoA dehydrogenase